jgi:CO/xanthine dehydrogenase Mo-binding subunit
VAQGIGWALNEEYIYDKNGRLDNPGYLDYQVPVAPDIPMIDAVLVEVPNPAHPYGAKGVGEVDIVPPMAAIAKRDRQCHSPAAHRIAHVTAQDPRRPRPHRSRRLET